MTKSILLLAAVATLAGCGSKDTPAPGSAFSGKVQLTNEFGKPQATQSGVLVTITDLTPQLTTQTAADGTYTLTNVPDGSHALSYTKTGYGTYRSSATTDPRKTQALDAITLSQPSSTVVTLNPVAFEIREPKYNITTMYLISGKVSPAPTAAEPRPHRLFLQAHERGYPSPPVANAYGLTMRGFTRPDGTFVDTLSANQLALARLLAASTTEVRVWGTGDNPSASTYYDEVTSKFVYPAANLAINSNYITVYTSY